MHLHLRSVIDHASIEDAMSAAIVIGKSPEVYLPSAIT